MPTVGSSEQTCLLRRARRVAQLRHPNLVRMLPMPGGAGFVPILGQGRRLADFTPAGTFKRFELAQVVRILLDVLNGLSALHEDIEAGLGFVQGEVSPQHIYVADDGTARLVPLLAWHWTLQAPTSPNGYSAPEFLLSARVDPRADLFSVGVMLGEALTGRPLFPDPALDAVLVRLLGGKLLPLLPTAENHWALPLCAIAERAISPYPELRFQTAVELSNAIGAAVAPQLAAREQDTWQAEAPTLVRVPRTSIVAFRTLTPLATVLEITPARDSMTPPASAPPPRPGALVAGCLRSWPHRWLVAISAAAIAGLALLTRTPPKHELLPSAARQPLAASVASLASPPRSRTMATPPMSASAAGALPTSVPIAIPSAPAPAAKRPTPRQRKLGSAAGREDYGI